MKTVFVCSAYGGSEANLVLARDYCRFVFDTGCAPFAPHLIYPQMLDDSFEQEREFGIKAGLEFLQVCDEMWVFVKDGIISKGMQKEINHANEQGVSIKWFSVSAGKITQVAIDGVTNKTSKALADVAESLKNGKTYEQVMQWLDFLTPDSVEPDESLNEQWESNYRNKD
jgi:hypothetical protein